MNLSIALCAAALSLLSVACATSSPDRPAMPECGFRTLLRGYDSAIASQGVRLARNDAELRALWREHTANRLPASEPPKVDFAREMVALVTLGTRTSGGFAIEVTNVCEKDGRVEVEARESKPAEGAILPMVMTQPYHLIATSRHEAPSATLRVR